MNEDTKQVRDRLAKEIGEPLATRIALAQEYMVDLFDYMSKKYPPETASPDVSAAIVMALGGMYFSFIEGIRFRGRKNGTQKQTDDNIAMLQKAAELLGTTAMEAMNKQQQEKAPGINNWLGTGKA